jgi:hypothetical protein
VGCSASLGTRNDFDPRAPPEHLNAAFIFQGCQELSGSRAIHGRLADQDVVSDSGLASTTASSRSDSESYFSLVSTVAGGLTSNDRR